jgi:hypothetical protein
VKKEVIELNDHTVRVDTPKPEVRAATQKDIGTHVIFADPTGKQHDALILAAWGPHCINVVYVVDDPNQKDNYGRKTYKGATSVMHGNYQEAHGYYWLWPNEERKAPSFPDTAKEE